MGANKHWAREERSLRLAAADSHSLGGFGRQLAGLVGSDTLHLENMVGLVAEGRMAGWRNVLPLVDTPGQVVNMAVEHKDLGHRIHALLLPGLLRISELISSNCCERRPTFTLPLLLLPLFPLLMFRRC